jgi:hypothetical protein
MPGRRWRTASLLWTRGRAIGSAKRLSEASSIRQRHHHVADGAVIFEALAYGDGAAPPGVGCGAGCGMQPLGLTFDWLP